MGKKRLLVLTACGVMTVALVSCNESKDDKDKTKTGMTCDASGHCVCDSGGDYNSSANCGKCGTVCDAGKICDAGTCKEITNNCSNCGADEHCVAGTCKNADPSCITGRLGDDKNCSKCGDLCAVGSKCDHNTCVTILTNFNDGVLGDNNNCGSCGNACTGEDLCFRGVCTAKSIPFTRDDTLCKAKACSAHQGCFSNDGTAVCLINVHKTRSMRHSRHVSSMHLVLASEVS